VAREFVKAVSKSALIVANCYRTADLKVRCHYLGRMLWIELLSVQSAVKKCICNRCAPWRRVTRRSGTACRLDDQGLIQGRDYHICIGWRPHSTSYTMRTGGSFPGSWTQCLHGMVFRQGKLHLLPKVSAGPHTGQQENRNSIFLISTVLWVPPSLVGDGYWW
jgi:hypothetical protein